MNWTHILSKPQTPANTHPQLGLFIAVACRECARVCNLGVCRLSVNQSDSCVLSKWRIHHQVQTTTQQVLEEKTEDKYAACTDCWHISKQGG